MSLISKLGNKSRIAIASLGIMGFSGCASTDGNDSGAQLSLIGAVLGMQGDRLAGQGQMQRAASANALSNVAGGMAQHQRQMSVAQQGRTQITINNASSQGLELVATNIMNIPFDPYQGGIKPFGRLFKTNYNGKMGLAVGDERYVFNRGETIHFLMHYPQNRSGNRFYGVWSRYAGDDNIRVIMEPSNLPSFLTLGTTSFNSLALEPGAYEILLVGGEDSTRMNPEAAINILIR